MIRRKWSPQEILLGTGFLLAVVGLLTFYVWYQTEAVHLGIKISERQELIKVLEDDVRKLELQKSALLSPERVEKKAKEDLGLVHPKPEDLIYNDQNDDR